MIKFFSTFIGQRRERKERDEVSIDRSIIFQLRFYRRLIRETYDNLKPGLYRDVLDTVGQRNLESELREYHARVDEFLAKQPNREALRTLGTSIGDKGERISKNLTSLKNARTAEREMNAEA